MNRKIAIAAAWLGLLMWAEPAVAADDPLPLSVTVGRHRSIQLSDDKVDAILAEASKALKKCNVVLKRKGHVSVFASTSTPSTIKKPAQRDAVHKENFDIKVVDFPIEFCRVSQMHEGCAYDPPPGEEQPRHKSMIVSDLQDPKIAGRIWAHEFGHRTGLPHRNDRGALMLCQVPVGREAPDLTDHECGCIRKFPGSCNDALEPAQQCSIGR